MWKSFWKAVRLWWECDNQIKEFSWHWVICFVDVFKIKTKDVILDPKPLPFPSPSPSQAYERIQLKSSQVLPSLVQVNDSWKRFEMDMAYMAWNKPRHRTWAPIIKRLLLIVCHREAFLGSIQNGCFKNNWTLLHSIQYPVFDPTFHNYLSILSF